MYILERRFEEFCITTATPLFLHEPFDWAGGEETVENIERRIVAGADIDIDEDKLARLNRGGIGSDSNDAADGARSGSEGELHWEWNTS